jgi:hypothetical protein
MIEMRPPNPKIPSKYMPNKGRRGKTSIGTENVIAKPNYPQPIESEATQLPHTASRLYGCMNCDWKSFGMCPFGYVRGTGHNLKDNHHAQWICQDRRNYLLSFVPPSLSAKPGKKYVRVKYGDWKKYYLEGIAVIQSMEDWQLMKQRENELRDYETELRKLEYDKLSKEKKKQHWLKHQDLLRLRMYARKDWERLNKALLNSVHKDLDRNTPKKLDITMQEKPSLRDIWSAIDNAKKVIDGEVVEE